MEKNQVAVLDITGVNSEGEGIARHGDDGYVVFVRGALPGERVKGRIVRVQKKFATAVTLDLVTASDVRKIPKCRHYGKCGGCQLQHASYGAQAAIKAKILTDALRRIAKIELPYQIDCTPSPEEWGYRNKTALPVQAGMGRGKSSLVCGYYEQGSHNIVPFRECPVLTPLLQKVVPSLIAALDAANLKGYDEKGRSGDIRYIAARSGGSVRDEEALSCVVAAHDYSKRELGRLKNVHQKLGVAVPALSGSVLNINTDSGNFIWGPAFQSLNGKRQIEQRLAEYRFQTDISAFFQVNRGQAETMFSHVRECVREIGAQNVLELYSGVGSLTAYLSGVVEQIDAVEEWRPAVRQMEENMTRNGARNVRVHPDAVERFLSQSENTRSSTYDTVVLDPPRTGCPEAATDAIGRIAPNHVVYVSCNPATLARDVARLMEDGRYEIRGVRAFDMFPQTAHVETVAVLARRR
ncbi:23S rRNA (uracil(1939)-C(5))-methyltransferase RlmD [Synergistaceae bacterium OttesenSCG-928-I11]|nr:23S rRNA (uracil(1939)-C(5))-methyltransferase RlmD [Synergistaceae bacterium OttesenSCG-928-I11]